MHPINSFSNLPPELQQEVLQYVENPSALRVCRFFYQFFSKSQKETLQIAYPHLSFADAQREYLLIAKEYCKIFQSPIPFPSEMICEKIKQATAPYNTEKHHQAFTFAQLVPSTNIQLEFEKLLAKKKNTPRSRMGFFNRLARAGLLRHIVSFTLHGVQINCIPSSLLLPYTNLQVFRATKCGLEVFPTEVYKFPHLQELSLSENALSIVPSGIGKLTRLELLDLRNNPIKHLPPQIRIHEYLTVLLTNTDQIKKIS